MAYTTTFGRVLQRVLEHGVELREVAPAAAAVAHLPAAPPSLRSFSSTRGYAVGFLHTLTLGERIAHDDDPAHGRRAGRRLDVAEAQRVVLDLDRVGIALHDVVRSGGAPRLK